MKPDLSDAITAARNLLGWRLVHDSPEGRTSGIIVETEAYTMDDQASHTYRGKTFRNAPMFERAGTVYVYFTYGMHYCVNIVTGEAGNGQAVLIRALEPIEGIELMRTRRGVQPLEQLTPGPAKLVQAMGIDRDHNGSHLDSSKLYLEPDRQIISVTQTTRVGIKKAIDHPWRFYVTDSPYISKR